jgi:hypothetical protein
MQAVVPWHRDWSLLSTSLTRAGKEFIANVVEAPAYPGAKNSFLIEDQIEDGEWLTNLLTVTAAELPAPKPRKKKK